MHPQLTVPNDTLLFMDSIGLPRFSARGLTQTLEPIEQSFNQKRTINGLMNDLALPQFKKYKTTITCKDQQPPALDGLFPGLAVNVYCVKELAYPRYGTASRLVVTGSDYLSADGNFIIYRPILYMVLQPWSDQIEEWNAV